MYDAKGEEPPCEECDNQQPEILLSNELIMDLLDVVWPIRDSGNRMRFDAFTTYMDLAGLSHETQLECFEQAVFVEGVIARIMDKRRKVEEEDLKRSLGSKKR